MPATRLEAMFGAATSLVRLGERTDAELLAGFLDHHDQTPFETLLVRHTPAVRAAATPRGGLPCWGTFRRWGRPSKGPTSAPMPRKSPRPRSGRCS